jgi:hypothetical protein
MKIGPLRTLALCATCAALAGAGSAALADDGNDAGPTTTAAPPEKAGQTLMMRKCVLDPANKSTAGDGARTEKCTVTAGSPPPDGVKPPDGGCVKLELGAVHKADFASGAGDKAGFASGPAARAKAAAIAKEAAAAAAR